MARIKHALQRVAQQGQFFVAIYNDQGLKLHGWLNSSHWCPLNQRLIFRIMLFLKEKQWKAGVRDLNSMEQVLLFAPDEFLPIHPLSSSRFGPLPNPLPFVRALQCRDEGEAFWSSSLAAIFTPKSCRTSEIGTINPFLRTDYLEKFYRNLIYINVVTAYNHFFVNIIFV